VDSYTNRTEWEVIEEIADDRLPDLGYISAARVRRESAERQALKTFLEALANAIRKHGGPDLSAINEKTKRRMDSLLRKFNSSLPHGLFSPLFAPDDEALVSRILTTRLNAAGDDQLIAAIRSQWADFDLYGEAERIPSKMTSIAIINLLDHQQLFMISYTNFLSYAPTLADPVASIDSIAVRHFA
jgi:hypothetical protein